MSKTIFIVDDNAFMQIKLKSVIKQIGGYEILGTASDGIEALHFLENEEPDIITLDLTMPNMDGLEFLEKFKSLNKKSKVVVVSAVGHETNVMKAIKLGAMDFIKKPYDLPRLEATLKRL